MAKRFTDTDKWKRKWYRALSLKAKVAWQYLCDQCDHAGIFIVDYDLFSFQVNFKIGEKDLFTWFHGKLIKIDDDKIFIPSFFQFQYKDTKDNFSAKKSAVKLLSAYNLIDKEGKLKFPEESGGRVGGESMDSTSNININIKGKIKGKIKTDGASNPEPDFSTLDCLQKTWFDDFWKLYPNRVNKCTASLRFMQQITTESKWENLKRAVSNYKARLEKESSWLKPKQADIFLGPSNKTVPPWVECLEPDYGECDIEPQDNLSKFARGES